MKRYHLLKVAAMLVLCCAMFGCGKESKLGSIYGTVTDFSTGDPIDNANVRLNPLGETTLTGYDGTFQFNDVHNGTYSLSLSKNGYVDLEDDYVIEIGNGNSVHRDVQLKHGVVVTVNGLEIDTLDFGSDINFNRMSFLVTNNTMTFIRVDLGSSSNWIGIWIPGSDTGIYSNQGKSFEIEIKRSLLHVGNNIGYVYINAGSFSKTLVIKATRV